MEAGNETRGTNVGVVKCNPNCMEPGMGLRHRTLGIQ